MSGTNENIVHEAMCEAIENLKDKIESLELNLSNAESESEKWREVARNWQAEHNSTVMDWMKKSHYWRTESNKWREEYHTIQAKLQQANRTIADLQKGESTNEDH